MGGSRSERRRRVRHALSVLGEARTFLEENPDASDVAIKCVDGTFRMTSLVLAAISPTLRETLLESTCSCGGGEKNIAADAASSVVVVDPDFDVSVADVADFFAFALDGRPEQFMPIDLAPIRKVCIALQVKRRYLPSVIFTRDFAFKTLKKRPHEQQQSQGAITVTTVEVEGAPSKEKNSEVSPPVSEGYESGNFDLSPQERAHLYACQYCSDTFLSRSGRESHLQSQHGVRPKKRPRPPTLASTSASRGQDYPGNGADDDDYDDDDDDEEEEEEEEEESASAATVAPVTAAILGPSGQYPVRTDVRTLAVRCLHCHLEFPGCQSLRTHVRSEHPQCALSCLMCGAQAESETALFRHIQTHTSDPDNVFFPCKFCRMNFSVRYDLRTHIRRAHSPQPPSFRCQECGSAFFNSRVLSAHVSAEHGGRVSRRGQLLCPHCDRSFRYFGLLERHIRSHLGAKGHVCEACGSSFQEEEALRRHWVEAHGGKEQGQREAEERGEVLTEKSYGCDLCGKMFPLRGYLMRHLRSEEHREKEAQRAVNSIIRKVREQQQGEGKEERGGGGGGQNDHDDDDDEEDRLDREETARAAAMLVGEEEATQEEVVVEEGCQDHFDHHQHLQHQHHQLVALADFVVEGQVDNHE